MREKEEESGREEKKWKEKSKEYENKEIKKKHYGQNFLFNCLECRIRKEKWERELKTKSELKVEKKIESGKENVVGKRIES